MLYGPAVPKSAVRAWIAVNVRREDCPIDGIDQLIDSICIRHRIDQVTGIRGVGPGWQRQI